MDVASLGYRTDLMIRRLAGSEITDHGSHLVVRTPGNPDFWWGNFLLLPAPPVGDDVAAWVETFHREFPQAEHVALGVDGLDGQVGDRDAIARTGLEVEFSVVLTTDRLLPPPASAQAPPARPLTSDEDWAQLFDQRIAGLEGDAVPGYLRFLERTLREYRHLTETGHGTWYAAFVEGTLVASAGLLGDGGVLRFQSVETHPAHRRRGLATAVVDQIGRHGLHEAGARELVIVADEDGPAAGIYRSLGFLDAERQVRLSRGPARDSA